MPTAIKGKNKQKEKKTSQKQYRAYQFRTQPCGN